MSIDQAQEELNEDLDALEMSDEDFLNTPTPAYVAPVEPETAEEEEQEEEEEQAEEEEQEAGSEEEQEKSDDEQEPSDKEEAAKDAEQEEKPESAEDKEPKEKDYKAICDRLFAPFRANGRDMQVESVEDAIALMQMGANYNKKMAALKPNLKLLKVLENNNLLSEEKIGFLIDLDKRDPAAIGKLLKDSGIDPLDVDVDKAKEYAPRTYAVDDRELELDSVLDEIQDTPTYSKTVSVVSNKWDAASKQVVAENPQLLRVINDHMISGVYDVIVSKVERERMLGRLKGLSDIEAYRQVGDGLAASGGFDHLFKRSVEQPAPAKVPVPAKPKVQSSDLRDKKRAASSPKPATSAPAPQEFNPLAMSDEDFSKLNPKYV